MKKVVFTFILFYFLPVVGLAAEEGGRFDPGGVLDPIRENLTIPFDAPELKDNLPSPGETLEKYSPKLKEFNKDIQEETGIDFAKFFGWVTKILSWLFQTILEALQSLAEALQS